MLYRFGKNGYTALDWYDAADPRPDYYRNLPSYYWDDNEDLNRLNKSKSMWATDAWQMNLDNIAHINSATCVQCGKCASKCPAKVIITRREAETA